MTKISRRSRSYLRTAFVSFLLVSLLLPAPAAVFAQEQPVAVPQAPAVESLQETPALQSPAITPLALPELPAIDAPSAPELPTFPEVTLPVTPTITPPSLTPPSITPPTLPPVTPPEIPPVEGPNDIPPADGDKDGEQDGGIQLQSGVAANKWVNSYAYEERLPEPSGAFTYDIPIITPPGRNGIEPNLRLSYNSQSRDFMSPFGLGWSINIPYIERINKNGADKIYTQNYFRSSLDGDLATTSATSTATYGAKFADGEIRQYMLSNSSTTWTVIDSKGVQYIFGSSTEAQMASSSNIFRWMLSEPTLSSP